MHACPIVRAGRHRLCICVLSGCTWLACCKVQRRLCSSRRSVVFGSVPDGMPETPKGASSRVIYVECNMLGTARQGSNQFLPVTVEFAGRVTGMFTSGPVQRLFLMLFLMAQVCRGTATKPCMPCVSCACLVFVDVDAICTSNC